MNRSRSIYIHTKKKEVIKSYKQTVYIRYQNQNGTWERWDDTSAITENVLCGSTYTFDTKNITGNSNGIQTYTGCQSSLMMEHPLPIK